MADVYVLDKHNNLIPSMTKEEIIAAIQTAAAGGSLEGFDNCSFVTKVKEINKNADFGFWVGTQAEYNAISTREKNVLYLISDSAPRGEIVSTLNALRQEVSSYAELVNTLRSSVDSHNDKVAEYAAAVEAAGEKMGTIETLLAETNELIKEVAPQVIFENAEGTTNAMTTKPITEFREIAIDFFVDDNGNTRKYAYQHRISVAELQARSQALLIGHSYFSYTDSRKMPVIIFSVFDCTTTEIASSFSLTTKGAGCVVETKDFGADFIVGITKIYGIGAKEGA